MQPQIGFVKMKTKIFFSISTVIIIFICFKFLPIKDVIYETFPNLKTDYRKHLFKPKSMINHLKNDYNVKFIPETEFLIGTPASINASDEPHTVAIDDDPFDSVISETNLMV